MTDLKFLNALNTIPGVGPVTLRALKNHFGTFEAAWHAPESALAGAGLTPRAIQLLLWKRPSLAPDREMERLIKEQVSLITDADTAYPPALKEIPHPPIALYIRGKFTQQIPENISCAVVGSRKPTHYGLEACESIVTGLAHAGITIVSGLALGIDARAHETALAAAGRTIAVLGSGSDDASLYPRENRGLLRRIIESGGAILSEYPPGTPALREHFPQRNRIVSGISRGVLVIEARIKSGSLITPRLALEQNRDVFAIPGSIFSLYAEGPHRLIQEGAKLVSPAADILEEWGIEYTIKESSAAEGLGTHEEFLLGLLAEPLSIDDLKNKTKLETSAIVTSLSLLELEGRVRNLGQDTYQRI